MREKISLTLGECTDEDGFVFTDLAVPELEALFTAETAAMRGALEKIARVWEQSSLQGEGELRNDLMMTKHIADTALKGGTR